MVIINDRIADINFNVDITEPVNIMLTLNSGVGKSYYSNLVCQLLGKQGKLGIHIKYNNLPLLKTLADTRVFLLILDEFELYDNIVDLNSILKFCDNLWIISRLMNAINIRHSCIEVRVAGKNVNIRQTNCPF